MNTELTHAWVDKVLGTFSFRRRNLVWDSYECHIEDRVKSSLHAKKIDILNCSWWVYKIYTGTRRELEQTIQGPYKGIV